MSKRLASRFTLIIPTFNRPDALGRLLVYLERRKAGFPILVLDSSVREIQAKNSELLRGLALDGRHLAYDPDTPPFEKFWRGAQEVPTEFCSLCGDDDVVMVESLGTIVDHLCENPDHSAGHGLYFTFYQSHEIGLTSIVYSSPSIDADDRIVRLRDFFRRYQAVTYGLYRTSVLQLVLERVRGIPSVLGRELLSGALTIASGKIARLPLFYYGRSLGPSETYTHWHPVEWMIDSPEEMFRQYLPYREVLVDYLLGQADVQLDAEHLRRLVDYMHLGYLAEYMRQDLFDYIADQMVSGADPHQTLQGVWPRLAPGESRVMNALRRSRLLRRLRDRFFPALRPQGLPRLFPGPRERVLLATTVGGRDRKYRLYKDFFLGSPPGEVFFGEDEIQALLSQLDAYE